MVEIDLGGETTFPAVRRGFTRERGADRSPSRTCWRAGCAIACGGQSVATAAPGAVVDMRRSSSGVPVSPLRPALQGARRGRRRARFGRRWPSPDRDTPAAANDQQAGTRMLLGLHLPYRTDHDPGTPRSGPPRSTRRARASTLGGAQGVADARGEVSPCQSRSFARQTARHWSLTRRREYRLPQVEGSAPMRRPHVQPRGCRHRAAVRVSLGRYPIVPS